MPRTIDRKYLHYLYDDDLPALEAAIARTPESEWRSFHTFDALVHMTDRIHIGGNTAPHGSEPLEIRSYRAPYDVRLRNAPIDTFVSVGVSEGALIRNIGDVESIFEYWRNSYDSDLTIALRRTKFPLNNYKNAIIIDNNNVRPPFRGHRTLPNMYKALYAHLKVPYTPDTVCLLNPHPYELGALEIAPLGMRKRLVRYYESFGFRNINPECPFANLEIDRADEDFRYAIPCMAHVPNPDTELTPEERKVLVDPFA